MKAKVKRIGRYWIDKSLLDEGYGPDEIFEKDESTIELPELIDPYRRQVMRWLKCPRCEEISQVEYGLPVCDRCGWGENGRFSSERTYKCAA